MILRDWFSLVVLLAVEVYLIFLIGRFWKEMKHRLPDWTNLEDPSSAISKLGTAGGINPDTRGERSAGMVGCFWILVALASVVAVYGCTAIINGG